MVPTYSILNNEGGKDLKSIDRELRMKDESKAIRMCVSPRILFRVHYFPRYKKMDELSHAVMSYHIRKKFHHFSDF